MTRMLVTLAAICTLAIAAPAPLHARDRDTDRAELVEIKEVRWNQFYRERDAEGLAAFLHDDFVLLGADGSRGDKAEALDYVRNNDWPLATRNFRYEVLDVQFADKDTANVFGRGTYDGPDCRTYYISSNILVRDKDRWRPIFSHTSPSACLEEE